MVFPIESVGSRTDPDIVWGMIGWFAAVLGDVRFSGATIVCKACTDGDYITNPEPLRNESGISKSSRQAVIASSGESTIEGGVSPSSSAI